MEAEVAFSCPDPDVLSALADGRLRSPRRDVVAAHVAECDECGAVLGAAAPFASGEVSVDQTLTSLTARSPWPLLYLASGSVVGRFRIERPLGRGATAAVYLAEDATLGRPVALKFPRLPASETERRRALFEARAIAALGHPNIVAIYDVGEHEEHPYLALEYVDGMSLRARFERGAAAPLPLGESLAIVHAVAVAVAFAHARGIIHQDLKPENVVLPTEGAPRVLDFGLAAIIGEADVVTEQLPAHGTPAYMAPEQWRVGGASTASDVWALGVILHELCTGERPLRASTLAELRRAALAPEPVPILAAALPPGLAALLGETLARDPAKRPTAEEVTRRLGLLLDRERKRRGGRLAPRSALGAASALALLVVVATAFAVRSARSIDHAPAASALGAASAAAAAAPCPALEATPADADRPAPIQVAAAALASTRATVRWRLAAKATAYTVLWSTEPCFDPSRAHVETITATQNGGRFDHYGLTPGTRYFYRVIANYPSGASAPTSDVSADTSPLPIAAPTRLKASADGDVNTLHWDLVPGATRYAVLTSDSPGLDPATTPLAYVLGETPVLGALGVFRHLGRKPGSIAYYRVVPLQDGRSGPASDEVAVRR